VRVCVGVVGFEPGPASKASSTLVAHLSIVPARLLPHKTSPATGLLRHKPQIKKDSAVQAIILSLAALSKLLRQNTAVNTSPPLVVAKRPTKKSRKSVSGTSVQVAASSAQLIEE
jgi:hypothetical protein